MSNNMQSNMSKYAKMFGGSFSVIEVMFVIYIFTSTSSLLMPLRPHMRGPGVRPSHPGPASPAPLAPSHAAPSPGPGVIHHDRDRRPGLLVRPSRPVQRP
jgi:hypothetical protein